MYALLISQPVVLFSARSVASSASVTTNFEICLLILRANCCDIAVEPALHPVLELDSVTGNTQKAAGLDASAMGFWQYGQRIFFDVRVVNPLARTNTANPRASN